MQIKLYRGSSKPLWDEKGVILIWVFWLLLALSVIVLGVMQKTKFYYGATSVGVHHAQMRHAAEGAFHQVVDELLTQKSNKQLSKVMSFNYVTNGLGIRAVATRENGKININKASEDLLSAAFAANGTDEKTARAIAAAIIDWRDPDELPRPGGAEAIHYMRDGENIKPRNGPFETVGELLFVRGVTDDVFQCVEPFLSVYTNSETPSLSNAGDDVKQIFQWAEQRRWQGKSWVENSTGSSVLNPYASQDDEIYDINIKVKGPGKSQFIQNVILRLMGGLNAPYDVLVWRQLSQTPDLQACEAN